LCVNRGPTSEFSKAGFQTGEWLPLIYKQLMVNYLTNVKIIAVSDNVLSTLLIPSIFNLNKKSAGPSVSNEILPIKAHPFKRILNMNYVTTLVLDCIDNWDIVTLCFITPIKEVEMFIFLLHLNRSFFASSSYLLQCILYINCLHSGSMLVHIFASKLLFKRKMNISG
jgi:hypothetical protein